MICAWQAGEVSDIANEKKEQIQAEVVRKEREKTGQSLHIQMMVLQ